MATVLAGRGGEAALLRGLIHELPEASATVVVHGEAGIGKTSLVRSVLDEQGSGGPRLLRGACAPMSSAMPYGALAEALGLLAPEPTAGPFRSPAAGRAWAVGRLREALGEGSHRGTVLLVDDVHWADWSTLDFLAHMTRNLPDRGLLVVLTWRDEQTGPRQRVWLGEQLRHPAVIDVPLSRLTLEQTAEQLERLVPGGSHAMVSAIYRRSAGNPYVSAELAGGGGPDMPTTLRQVLLARLQSASSPARTVVAATALLARPLSDDALLAATGGDAIALYEAADAGLTVRDAGGTTARHPVLAEVAYEQLLTSERRQLHLRLAEHLAAELSTRRNASAVAEVAEQYRRGGDSAGMLTWAVEAARAAEADFALAEAGHWYGVASAVPNRPPAGSDDLPARLVLAEAAAALLGGADQQDTALALLDDALAEVGDAPADDVVPALLTRSWLQVVIGDTDAALQDIDRAEQLAPAGDGLVRGRILCARGMALVTCSRLEEGVPPARLALDLADRYGDRETACRTNVSLGTAAAMRGRYDEAAPHLERALSLGEELGQPEEIALSAVCLSDLRMRLGDTDGAVGVADRVRPLLRRLTIGRHWLEDLIDGNVIDALFLAGRWDEAQAWADDQEEMAGLGLMESSVAQLHVARGDVESAIELQRRSERLERGDQPQFKLGFAELQVRLLLLQDRPREALTTALAAAEVVHSSEGEGAIESDLLLLAGLEAAVELRATPEFDRLVHLLVWPAWDAAAAAMTAVVAGERSRLLGASDPAAWLDAAREWKRLGWPYPEAKARLCAAEAILGQRGHAGARPRAVGELRAAQHAAEALGAAPLLDEIRGLAKTARIRLDDPSPQQPAEVQPPKQQEPLTDRERQVLRLLTEGKTNREIAGVLYMSPKTASVHVTHILQKLGVQSRVQAAAEAVRLGLTR